MLVQYDRNIVDIITIFPLLKDLPQTRGYRLDAPPPARPTQVHAWYFFAHNVEPSVRRLVGSSAFVELCVGRNIGVVCLLPIQMHRYTPLFVTTCV